MVLRLIFLVDLEFNWNRGFWGEGKCGIPGEKPLRAEERTNKRLMIHAEGSDLNPGHIRGVRARSHHCARTLALYKQKNDGLLWGAITLINCLLINFFLLLFQNTAFLLILSLIICNDVITVQQSPCQIQSFYAREIGSGEGNLLRVHLDTAGIPTNVSISGSCDSTKIKFSSKLFIFLVVMKNFN